MKSYNLTKYNNTALLDYYYYIADYYIGLTVEQVERGSEAFKIGLIGGALFDESLEMDEPEQNGELKVPEDVVVIESPRYPISVWNAFNRAQDELPRTNNSLEAFNGVFKVNFIEKNL